MTLLALLLATLALRSIPDLKALQSTAWMQALEDALVQWLPPVLAPPRAMGVALLLLPVGVLTWMLDHWLAERSLLASLLVQKLVLIHVLRLPELNEEAQTESAQFPGAFAVDEQELLAQVQGWFGPAFWFALLGPAGAVLYRMINLQAQVAQNAEDSSPYQRFRWLVNFPVAQLMGLGLAVVDNFAPVFHHWKNQQCPDTGSRLDLRCRFLGQVLRLAVDDAIHTANQLGETELDAANPAHRRQMVLRLMWRVQWVWLTVLALLTLGGLLA